MLNQNNEFTHAGKGRRRRIRLDEIPRALTSRRIKPQPAEKSLSEETGKRETREISAQGMKATIRRLTLRTTSFAEVCDELRCRNISASGVLVSSVRSDMREAVKLLIEEGLLDEQRLERYRREYQRDRKR